LIGRLATLTRRNALIALHDALVTAFAVVASFYLRFEGDNLADRLPILLRILPSFVLFSVVVCFVFQLTVTKWRFFSLPDVANIVKAASVLTIALLVLDYIFLAPNVYGTFFFGKTTIVIYWFLEIFFLSGTRAAYRYFRYTRTRNRARIMDASPTLLIGRAAEAEVLLRGIESGAVKRFWPIGVLSPSPADLGQSIRGTGVLGRVDDLREVVEDLAKRGRKIERVVLMPSVFDADNQMETVMTRARKLGLAVSRIPSLEETGDAPQLAPVAIEDLLLRPTAKIDYRRIESLVSGASVVVTGGGGSIGAEICRRLVAYGVGRLLIIENSETALFDITEALTPNEHGSVVDGRIADIRDRDRLFQIIAEFRPDHVFHAAALKHVPILERDWSEAVKTNIFGSVNVADAALAAGARSMVMISTDKAIEPVSMLGLTKRFAEMYCQALDRDLHARVNGRPPMRIIAVRFGNVLGSNGSVVPKFKAQIEAGGPVTVTHPDMVRYFMTIREACDLVLTAASHAVASERRDVSVYVLNMGQPVRILELAERMIRLSGLEPGHDIEIVFSGVRPGERLNEILFATKEPTAEIGIAGVVAAQPNELPLAVLRESLAVLSRATGGDNRAAIEAVLRDAVPEFRAEAG
jgi:O-antigen biosynthesis protein WbqV